MQLHVYLTLWKEKLVRCSLQRKLLHLEYGVGKLQQERALRLAMGGYREAMAALRVYLPLWRDKLVCG